MHKTLLIAAALVGGLSLAANVGLSARQAEDAFPSSLVGRWSRTVSHATWLSHGRDFPTARVIIDVDASGARVGYFGPDFNPTGSPSPGANNPDWYTDWAAKGTKLTIGAVPPCGWSDSWRGRYRWARSGNVLTIAKVSDKCGDRIAIFAGKWTKLR